MSKRSWRTGFPLVFRHTKSESHMQWEVIQALLYLEQVFIFSMSVRERCRQWSPQSSYCIPYRSSYTNSIKYCLKNLSSQVAVSHDERYSSNVTGRTLGWKKSASDDHMVPIWQVGGMMKQRWHQRCPYTATSNRENTEIRPSDNPFSISVIYWICRNTVYGTSQKLVFVTKPTSLLARPLALPWE